MRCPACYSGSIVSNKFDVPGGHEVGTVVKHARELGHPLAAALTGAAWFGAHAVNHFRKDYRCGNCGHTFNDD